MTEQEVKQEIGIENWDGFLKWMGGQTIGVTSEGKFDYYAWDVKSFKVKMDEGYDRQDTPGWD